MGKPKALKDFVSLSRFALILDEPISKVQKRYEEGEFEMITWGHENYIHRSDVTRIVLSKTLERKGSRKAPKIPSSMLPKREG